MYAYHTQDKTWREFKVEEREDLSFDPEKPPGEYSVQSANQLPMLWVEPGSFTMGSPNEEPGRSGDELQYLVTLGQREPPRRLINAFMQMRMVLRSCCFIRQC